MGSVLKKLPELEADLMAFFSKRYKQDKAEKCTELTINIFCKHFGGLGMYLAMQNECRIFETCFNDFIANLQETFFTQKIAVKIGKILRTFIYRNFAGKSIYIPNGKLSKAQKLKQTIISLYDGGMPRKQIAACLKISLVHVYKTIQTYKEKLENELNRNL